MYDQTVSQFHPKEAVKVQRVLQKETSSHPFVSVPKWFYGLSVFVLELVVHPRAVALMRIEMKKCLHVQLKENVVKMEFHQTWGRVRAQEELELSRLVPS